MTTSDGRGPDPLPWQTRLMDFRIRPAEPLDAAGIADVHVRTWQHAYRGLMPDALLDGLDVDSRAERWERILAGEDLGGRGVNHVAVSGEAIIGFSTRGPARDDDAPLATELYAIYADPGAHGTGVGAALLAAAIGSDPAYLWVLDGNARAIAFYTKHGFALDGAVKVDDRGDVVLRELRMVRG